MKTYAKVPFELIVAATGNDPIAIKKVVVFYESLIKKNAVRPFIETTGTKYFIVDEELAGMIKSRLLTRIPRFIIKK